MNRRKFIATAIGAIAAPNAVKALLTEVPKLTINPAWLNAPYEVVYLCSSQSFQRLASATICIQGTDMKRHMDDSNPGIIETDMRLDESFRMISKFVNE